MPRKFQKRPPARRPRRPRKNKRLRKPAYKYNKYQAPKLQSTREVKHIHTGTTDHELKFIAKSSSQMKNGVVLFPAGFNSVTTHISQGVGCDQLLGCWVRPLYCTHKFTINFSELDMTKTACNSGLRVRARSGWIKNTGQKSGCGLDGSATAWQSALNIMVHKELQESNMDEDYLSFERKSRNILIHKDSYLKPKLNQRVAAHGHIGGEMFAPEINFTINWNKTRGWLRNKTRLEPTHSHSDQLVLHNMWIPFIYFSCDALASDSGNILIQDASKFYFSDA